jgi:hypothetical protein
MPVPYIILLVVFILGGVGFLVWILSDMFAPHRAKGTWGEVAATTGLTHTPGAAFSTDPGLLTGEYRGRAIDIRGYNVMLRSEMRMQVRITFVTPLGRGFRLSRKIELTPVPVANPEGTVSVTTGDEAFDNRFEILAADPGAAAGLLGEGVRAAIVDADKGAFGFVITDEAIVHGSEQLVAEPADLVALLDRLSDLAETIEEAAR